MPHKINIAVFPNYNDVFEDGNGVKNLDFFLGKIPSSKLVNYVSLIQACLDYKSNDFEIQNYILKDLLKYLSWKERIQISNKINYCSNNPNKIVFHQIACMQILEYSILNYKVGEIRALNADMARNILKAFLICNTNFGKQMEDLVIGIKSLEDSKKVIGLNIVMDVAQGSFFYREKDVLEQASKVKLLEEFLLNDHNIGQYYSDYLEMKRVSSFSDIIRIIWGFYFKLIHIESRFNIEKIKNKILLNDNDKNIKQYLDCITIFPNLKSTDSIVLNDLDFKVIREKPLYLLKEDTYAVLNSNFFTDQIYHTVLFDYYKFILTKGYTKNFGDFKTYYSEIFVEKFLLRKILDKILEKQRYDVKQYGDEKKKHDKLNIDYSDYYLRIKNKIILFECKDSIMNANVKYSYDAEMVLSEINKKFVNKTGVEQLIKVISAISDRKLHFDEIQENDLKKLVIIPVIIFTDHTFNSRGINYYINTFFKTKLKDLQIKCEVQSIVMVHIDLLIKYQETLQKRVNFINTLERYNKLVEKNEKKLKNPEDTRISSLFPYDDFFIKYLAERNLPNVQASEYQEIYDFVYGKN